MSELTLALTDIRPPGEYGRPIDERKVDSIADSVREIGLRQPITVRPVRDDDEGADGCQYVIVAGQHRYLAMAQAKQETITCWLMDTDALHTELWTIDENLLRSEPSASERCRDFARRKAIYEALYPQTRHGGAREGAGCKANIAADEASSGQPGDLNTVDDHASKSEEATESVAPRPLRFTQDTADKTGRSERSVQREVKRGEQVAPDVLDQVAGTDLDTGSYLDRIARLTPDEQRERVEYDLNAPAVPRSSESESESDSDDDADEIPHSPEAPPVADDSRAEAEARIEQAAIEAVREKARAIRDKAGQSLSKAGLVMLERFEDVESFAQMHAAVYATYTPEWSYNPMERKYEPRDVILARTQFWGIRRSHVHEYVGWLVKTTGFVPDECSLCPLDPVQAYNRGVEVGVKQAIQGWYADTGDG